MIGYVLAKFGTNRSTPL